MMRVMGLPTALQFVVFGLVIIGGMLVSGDRIIRAWSRCSANGNGRMPWSHATVARPVTGRD